MDNKNRAGQAIIACIIAVLLFFAPSAALRPAWAQTVSDVVSSVEGHYRDVADISARVAQKNFLKAIGKTQKFEATLHIKKPGKLRLDYTNGQVVLVDGRTALFYSKKSEQVVKRTFTEFENMNIPVAFLLGAAHIRDDFDVLQTDAKTPRSLELLPKKPGAAMKKLLLRSDAAGRIEKLVIVDRSGNTSEVEFAGIRENGGIDDKLFIFTAPKGTEIIEQ